MLGAIWIARLGLYIGLMFGVGGTFYAEWIAVEPLSPGARKVVAAALECGVVATVISVGLQGVDAFNLPLSDLNNRTSGRRGLRHRTGSLRPSQPAQ